MWYHSSSKEHFSTYIRCSKHFYSQKPLTHSHSSVPRHWRKGRWSVLHKETTTIELQEPEFEPSTLRSSDDPLYRLRLSPQQGNNIPVSVPLWQQQKIERQIYNVNHSLPFNMQCKIIFLIRFKVCKMFIPGSPLLQDDSMDLHSKIWCTIQPIPAPTRKSKWMQQSDKTNRDTCWNLKISGIGKKSKQCNCIENLSLLWLDGLASPQL